MQLSPKPPIVVDENGDIEVYASVEDACAELEATDVNRGAYELFDSEGFRLRAEVSGYDVVGMSVASPNRTEMSLLRVYGTSLWMRTPSGSGSRTSSPRRRIGCYGPSLSSSAMARQGDRVKG